MKRRTFPKLPDRLKQEQVDQLLRIVEAFELEKRAVPGSVRRALVLLAPHWGKRRIPAVILEAQRTLGRTRR
jgi:hypothetical protein